MKQYEVTKKYIIKAQDETHLRVKLFNASFPPITPIERYLVRQTYKELREVPRRARKKRWNPWVATFASQLKYLVMGK